MRLRLLAAAAIAAAQIYRPDGAQTQTPFKKSIPKSVQRKISSSSHHISDGEHIKLDDGNLPSEIFLGRHTIKKPWSLGKYDNNVITVEDMYRIILKRRLHPVAIDFRDICHKDMGPTNQSIESICGRKFKDAARADRGPAQVPGILVRSTQNPCSKPYRMVDGAHRICRMKAAVLREGVFLCSTRRRRYH